MIYIVLKMKTVNDLVHTYITMHDSVVVLMVTVFMHLKFRCHMLSYDMPGIWIPVPLA